MPSPNHSEYASRLRYTFLRYCSKRTLPSSDTQVSSPPLPSLPRYPVILSIENHCTVPQQKKMAEYLREVLQDKLDLSNVNVHECKKLPSPEILKGKVLVKVGSIL